MNRIIFIIIFFLCSNISKSQEFTEISGNLSGSMPKGKYLAIDTITIPENNSLIIPAGTEIYFREDIHLLVRGNLLAEGTSDEKIIFTAENETWDGINFHHEATGTMENCIITKSHNNGISAITSNPRIFKCIISDNHAQDIGGGGIYLLGSNAKIEDCEIFNNSSNYEGGGIYMNSSSPVIKRTKIYNNQSLLMGGGIFAAMDYNSSKMTLINSMIARCESIIEGGGLHVSCFAEIINCTVALNRCSEDYPLSGGGLYAASQIDISNSVFAYNNAYGIFCDSDKVTVSYSNFFGNLIDDIYLCNPDVGIITTENRNGSECDKFFNIFVEPEFADTTANNFYLKYSSKIIDAGSNELSNEDNDINGFPRISDGNNDGLDFIDIGAYEYSFPLKADFSADTTNAIGPISVQFEDKSKAINTEITSWLWDFGDGSQSEEASPTHNYSSPGAYTVSLSISDDEVSDMKIKENYIVIVGAWFDSDIETAEAPAEISFENKSFGDFTCWLWDFGDGTLSREENPSHTYTNSGKYTIELIASDGNIIDKAKFIEYIEITGGSGVVEKKQKDIPIRIIPNPATEIISIQHTLKKPAWLEVNIIAIDGSRIDQIANNQHESGNIELQYDTSNLPAGTYIIEMKINNKSYVEKFIKLD